MALDLVSLVDSLENLLNKNNTITSDYDISENLNTRVQKFYSGTDGLHDKSPVPINLYPVVFIELVNKVEEISQLGNSSAKRNMEINFNIVPVIYYGAGSEMEFVEGRIKANQEVLYLSQNIESLIRNNITLSNTVDWVNIENTEYSISLNENATYNMVSKINCKAFKLSN